MTNIQEDAKTALAALVAELPEDAAERLQDDLQQHRDTSNMHKPTRAEDLEMLAEMLASYDYEKGDKRRLAEIEEESQAANEYNKQYGSLRWAALTIDNIAQASLAPCPADYEAIAGGGKTAFTAVKDAQQLLDYADGKADGTAPLQAIKDFVTAHRVEIEQFITQNQEGQREKELLPSETSKREHLKSKQLSPQEIASRALKGYAKGDDEIER